MSDTEPQGIAIRRAGRRELRQALMDARGQTLDTFAVYAHALGTPELAVPYMTVLNPPLWELGHVGWFQEWWIARNPHLQRGVAADPDVPRPDSVCPGGDALYHSSRVAHATRWQRPLPDIDQTLHDLERQLAHTVALLTAYDEETDAALYFFRLALLHEDMHHEAALYMAQTLGIEHPDAQWQPWHAQVERRALAFDAAAFRLGREGPGFAFDNELAAQDVPVEAYAIDSRAVNWAEFLPFVEAGGYDDARLWSEDGRRWREAAGARAPRDLKREDGTWLQRRGARWRPVQPEAAACHLTLHEAQAWCRWAGRRLPTEAQWERAAVERGQPGGDFVWGQVWEWTASAFAPYPGFQAHPYRDYSQPWFDGRPVLKGASWATQPRMRHPRYRNFFTADRCDIVAGFRSCAPLA